MTAPPGYVFIHRKMKRNTASTAKEYTQGRQLCHFHFVFLLKVDELKGKNLLLTDEILSVNSIPLWKGFIS